MKRSNTNHQGEVRTPAARGQTLITPIGKDSSDYSGSMANEVTIKHKLGGGMNNVSDSIPGKD